MNSSIAISRLDFIAARLRATKEQLKHKAISHMRKLQKLPKRVASYFQAKEIQYAAA